MAKIGIFYGSTTGYTADLANRIGKKLGVEMQDIHDVSKTAPSALGNYDILLLGCSTWGAGEMQENWEDFVDGAEELSLRGKKVAVFGCGDETMSDTFCNAVGQLYHRMQNTGAQFIGQYNADGYHFNHSEADLGGVYAGLMIDEINHPELTDARIDAWVKLIK